MKNNKLKILSLLAVCSISLCACNDETIDDSGNECTDFECETTESEEFTKYQSYSITPTLGDFGMSSSKTSVEAGSFTNGGLTWDYTEATYLGNGDNDRGLQIGSKNNPQKNPFTLTTNFNETVELVTFSIGLATNSNTTGSLTVTFGDSTIASNANFSSTTVNVLDYDELNLIGSSLSVSVSGTSGVYIKTISFGILTTEDSKLNLSSSSSSTSSGAGFTPQSRPYSATTDLTTYYANVNTSTSDSLKSDLYTLTEPQKTYTYGDARYNLLYTDAVVGDDSHVYGLYDGVIYNADWDYGATWNREHVWPQSHLGDFDKSLSNSDDDIRTDLHNLRACGVATNGAKGDKFFGDGSGNTYYAMVNGSDHRGDVARICFYMYVRYPELSLVNGSSGTSTQYGDLSTLIKWNEEDPVDEFEKQRNNRIEEYQGNRNPFIDHPEYADKLFA